VSAVSWKESSAVFPDTYWHTAAYGKNIQHGAAATTPQRGLPTLVTALQGRIKAAAVRRWTTCACGSIHPPEGYRKALAATTASSGVPAPARLAPSVRFRPITIDREEVGAPPGSHTDVVPDANQHIPPHARGGRTFDGQWLRIWCNVKVALGNLREIWANAQITVSETKPE
jgi:hypothetical protein